MTIQNLLTIEKKTYTILLKLLLRDKQLCMNNKYIKLVLEQLKYGFYNIIRRTIMKPITFST